MQRVGTREFKNRLGRYLRAVRTGHTLIITARGRAIAKLVPTEDEPSREKALWEKLEELAAQGYIRLGRGTLSKFRAVKSRGKAASEMIIEDRR
jgi:prevent-host-death family protein